MFRIAFAREIFECLEGDQESEMARDAEREREGKGEREREGKGEREREREKEKGKETGIHKEIDKERPERKREGGWREDGGREMAEGGEERKRKTNSCENKARSRCEKRKILFIMQIIMCQFRDGVCRERGAECTAMQ